LGFVADVACVDLEGTTRRDRLGGARAERAMISPLGALSSRCHDVYITITAHFMHMPRLIAFTLTHLQVKQELEWITIFIAVRSNHRLALALGLRIMASFVPIHDKTISVKR
jgi:hypothetical protein